LRRAKGFFDLVIVRHQLPLKSLIRISAAACCVTAIKAKAESKTASLISNII
jgi:hypothetical protein